MTSRTAGTCRKDLLSAVLEASFCAATKRLFFVYYRPLITAKEIADLLLTNEEDTKERGNEPRSAGSEK
jgi:hypothetical protein